MINQALYPVDIVEWCVYALYINDPERVAKYCVVETKRRHANLAINLGGYVWAISTLVKETLRIRCLVDRDIKTITPPLMIVHVGNGCEADSNTLYIPAKSELTSNYDLPERIGYFMTYNLEYQRMGDYNIWQGITEAKLTPEQKEALGIKLTTFGPMVLDSLKQRLDQQIIEDYHWSMPPNALLAMLIGTALIFAVIVAIFGFKIYRMKQAHEGQQKLQRFFQGHLTGSELDTFRRPFMNLIAPALPRFIRNRPQRGLPATPQLALPSTFTPAPVEPSLESIELAVHDLEAKGFNGKRVRKAIQKP